MSTCRFLIDECVRSSLIRGLRRRVSEVDAIQVGEPDAPAKGTPDENLLVFCEQESRLFVTADRATVPDFATKHLQSGGHTWGVLVLGPNTALSQAIDELVLIHTQSEAEEWIDVLEFMPMFH